VDEKHKVAGPGSERVDRNWLVLEHPENPIIRLDAGQIDRIRTHDSDVLFDVGDLQVSLVISGGQATATFIADRLSRYTRLTPITEPEVYEYAKRQLELLKAGADLHRSMVFVGDEPVEVDGQVLRIGGFTFPIHNAIRSGRVGESIRLPNGRYLQAGLALLVVAASEREDELDQLGRLVAEYEARTNP
jgi:hypothetical protein